MKKIIKIYFVLLSMVITFSLSACSNTAANDIPLDSIETLNTKTSQETLETAMTALIEADAKTFNSCVIYPEVKKGIILYKDNVYFGDNLDGESKEYIEYVFKYLSYEIEDIHGDENSAVIKTKISNRDLSRIDSEMLNYIDADDPYIEAIKNAEDNRKIYDVEISFQREGKTWKINIDDDFTKAISGGLWGKKLEIDLFK
ncbi:hypothetical protein ACTNDY_01475 [Tissierellaceae bacterium HCP3S3_D8]